ncbi:hypothetical protein [Flavobacterium hungaricum]|uniref:hypothetical protein n=1 Tax=Flavobacterium hungaricum TaxID=2082725 RepID=UPI00187EA997|nr:hypothetical protein [Flavobacterium hungaricum]
MKTIQFRTDDLVQYTVIVSHITCLFPADESLGTWIYLSCGTRLKAMLDFETVWEMIGLS